MSDYKEDDKEALFVCMSCAYAPCFAKKKSKYCGNDITHSGTIKWHKVTLEDKESIINLATRRDMFDDAIRSIVAE